MPCSKLIPVLLAAVCLAMPTSAHAQRRSSGGGRSVGTAAPRGGTGTTGRPIVGSPGRAGVAPYRPYSYPYRYYRPGLGFYYGFGYPYGYYGFGYGYPYYYPYGYAYPGYGYPGYGYGYPGYSYAYPPSGYVTGEQGAPAVPTGWGDVRIEDAPKDAQVFADGGYVGIVSDFDGPVHHLTLPAGVHRLEIRVAGQQPRVVDVNVQVGQTITYHAR
jgi:hypothetical protein